MRIVYLITRMDSIGGAQIHVRDLSLWLRQNGHDPIVVTGACGPICNTLTDVGVQVVEARDLVRPIRPLKDARAFLAITRILKEQAPALLSCHSSKAGIVGRIAAKAIGIPVIFTAHGWAFTDGVPELQRLAYKAIERLCGSFSDHIVTVCHHDRQLALAAKIAPASRITTIHNGMPLLPAVRRGLRNLDAARPIRIGMVARFDSQKDHATLLRALARLRSKSWRLQLIGGGDASQVARMAGELDLLDRIEFVGESSNVPALLAGMDIFCLISRWEGFPRSILEAMRASLPVIASDVAGVRESVEDTLTGYVVPVGDDRLLATSLGDLIDLPGLRIAMGNRGRARFENRFTLEHMLQPTLSLYQAAVTSAATEPALSADQGMLRSLLRYRWVRR
jgi:glycosyltransferase involved in cell wall biosynthesis